jgi:hypothetical protein
MSRTHRNTKYAKCLRNIHHLNYRRAELYALMEIKEELGDEYVNNRLRSSLGRIPTNWEDFSVSGSRENYSQSMYQFIA